MADKITSVKLDSQAHKLLYIDEVESQKANNILYFVGINGYTHNAIGE